MTNKVKSIITFLVFTGIVISSIHCGPQALVQEIKVTNRTNINYEDAFIVVKPDFESPGYYILSENSDLPYQIVEQNGKKQIAFTINLFPNEVREIIIKPSDKDRSGEFKTRTYAELAMKTNGVYFDKRFRGSKFENVAKIKVPEIHTDHDALFKYEGPGWESEKVGYRFYLDWRNATDIFGKKVNELVLKNVGVHDTVAKDDSYHNMQEWGMDIFKVGSSLGIGSIGMWSNGKVNMVSKTDSVYSEITENGPVRSAVKTTYYGWQVGKEKFNLESTMSITAGSRLTKTELKIDGDPANLVTGLAKYKGTSYVIRKPDNGWGYISLYGNQTLVNENDKLGIAVFFKSENLIDITEDDLSHIVKLKPINGRAQYYFCAAWEQEPNGIKNEKEFIEYLENTLNFLNNPPSLQ